MTGGQLANGVGSALVTIASASFILSYGILAKFYKTQIGRFMVLKAVGIFFTGVITVALTANNFTTGVDWLRYVQASLWAIVAVAYAYHTRVVWRSQVKGKRHDRQVP